MSILYSDISRVEKDTIAEVDTALQNPNMIGFSVAEKKILCKKNNSEKFTVDVGKLDGIEAGAEVNEVNEAPINGSSYVRKDGAWSEQEDVSQWKNGFNGADDPLYKYGIQYSWNAGTRTVSITHSSGTVKLFTYNTYYEYSNGSPQLSAVVASSDDDFFGYFDNTGQLVIVTSTFANNNSIPLYACIAIKLTYCTSAGDEILAIKEIHDAFEPIGIRGRLHNTTGTVWSSGATVTNASVGSNAISVSVGTAYDEDVKITMASQSNTTGIYPKYFFDGINASGNNRIKRGSLSNKIGLFDSELPAYFPTPTGVVVYNSYNTGTGQWELARIGNNNYMCMHLFGANGADFVADVDYSFALGQQQYNSIADARDGAESEAGSLVIGSTAVKEAVLLYTFIINEDGQIVAVDGTGATFIDWRSAKSVGNTGATNDQGINSVLQVDNDANGLGIDNLGSTTMKTTGNTTLKMESAGGVYFSEILARNLTTNAYQDLRVGANKHSWYLPVTEFSSSAHEFMRAEVGDTLTLIKGDGFTSAPAFRIFRDSGLGEDIDRYTLSADGFAVHNVKNVSNPETVRVFSLYDGSNYLMSIRADGTLLTTKAQIADLASQTMITDEIRVNHLANIASAVMGDTTESATATLHIAKRTGTGGYTVTGSLNGDYDGTYEAIADVNGFNAYRVTGQNKYLYAGEATLGGGAVGYVINDDTSGLWNSTVKFQQAVASLTNPANNFYIGIESPYTGLNASVALYGSTQNAIEAEDPILINGNEVKPTIGTMTDNYLYKYDLTTDSFVKTSAIIDDNGNLLVDGTGVLTIGVRSSNDAVALNLGTDVAVQTAYLIAYPSTHPQANRVFLKNSYGGAGISTGASGSNSIRMFIDDDGAVSMYALSNGLPSGKTDAGQVRITTDGELYIL